MATSPLVTVSVPVDHEIRWCKNDRVRSAQPLVLAARSARRGCTRATGTGPSRDAGGDRAGFGRSRRVQACRPARHPGQPKHPEVLQQPHKRASSDRPPRPGHRQSRCSGNACSRMAMPRTERQFRPEPLRGPGSRSETITDGRYQPGESSIGRRTHHQRDSRPSAKGFQ